jgi:hypothetical protein
VLAAASAKIAFNCALANSLGADTTLCTGRAQAANSASLRFGTATIFAFAVGDLCPRFRPMRSNLAHTALRLCPSRPIHSDCRVEVLEFDTGIGG